MRLIVISDIHSHTAHAQALHRACVGADALIACGDFTTYGNRKEIQKVADTLRPEGLSCFFVLGNCDANVGMNAELDGWTNLHGRVVPFGEWFLGGLGGTSDRYSAEPDAMMAYEYETGFASLCDACDDVPGERLVLVTHQPPFGTSADKRMNGQHVGAGRVRMLIDTLQPACCLSGHVHEAASRTACGKTIILNPGPFMRGRFTTLDL